MKRLAYLVLVLSLFPYQLAYSSVQKWMAVNNVNDLVFDNMTQVPITTNYYYNAFTEWLIFEAVWHMGCENWTDTLGVPHDIVVTGNSLVKVDEKYTTPVPDENGVTLHRIWRYTPPKVTVDGFGLDDPFPTEGDEVDPDKIPGTADMMLESTVNTNIGVTVHQRVLGWAQKNHDDYIIYEFTFTNTGNVDLDDEIELDGQTIENFYFHRYTTPDVGSDKMLSAYGERPAESDSLRISFAYPTRHASAEYDDFGIPDLETGWIWHPQFIGEATLHVDKSYDDETDDLAQPQMTGQGDADDPNLMGWPGDMGISQLSILWGVMTTGFLDHLDTPEMTGTYLGTHHSVRMDEQGYMWKTDVPWLGAIWAFHSASGPFTIPFGESIRIVYANVLGSISPEKGWEVGKAWLNGTAADLWDGDWYLPPHYAEYPELCDDDNDRAKDSWVYTGRDSLFQNAYAATWNVQEKDYNIPVAPPPPDITVTSFPDRINIKWDGYQSEAVADFAGYRVYRALGAPDYSAEGDVIVGKWESIFECGAGTDNPLTDNYDDSEPDRGKAYFYYVAAFDKAEMNDPGVFGVKESLESGKYLNRTTLGAYLTRPEGSLAKARVVPNPFNISAEKLQYPGEQDKILFLNVPGECDIRIYTESGDLVKTIEHRTGAGDASWGFLPEEWSTTNTGQIIVSGVYIAHITDINTGDSVILKFIVVR